MSESAAAPGLLSLLCHTTYTGHTHTGHTAYRTHSMQDTALTGERQRPFIGGLSIVTHVMKFLANAKQINASVLFSYSIAAGRDGVFGYCLLLLCSSLSIYCQATFYVSSFVVLTLPKSSNPGPHCHQPTCHTVTCFQSGRNVGVISIISCQIVLDCRHIQYMSAGEQVFSSTFVT